MVQRKSEGSVPGELPLLWEADLSVLFMPSTDYMRPTYVKEEQYPHSIFTNLNVNLIQKHALKLTQKLNHHRFIWAYIYFYIYLCLSLYRYTDISFALPLFLLLSSNRPESKSQSPNYVSLMAYYWTTIRVNHLNKKIYHACSLGSNSKSVQDGNPAPLSSENGIPFILFNSVKMLLIRIFDIMKVKCVISFFLDACLKWNMWSDLWRKACQLEAEHTYEREHTGLQVLLSKSNVDFLNIKD